METTKTEKDASAILREEIVALTGAMENDELRKLLIYARGLRDGQRKDR